MDIDGLRPMKLRYGAIEGTPRLSKAIASTYARQSAANVIALHDCMHDAASFPTAITACSISGDQGLL
ncbi:hypothetical protein BamMEX5DRAFT_5311 [Burkholderia ambifaria MEX-5]|uniref:Uncharacterized protein n=1 Tax=Burkholderia ambifaria MEX-5 TaxID=396597 RepID=B1TBZ5_9BURK|nr:hypothetical protein BamMEX5DRAFT_5311 [Burkholderia ambifaria MEX-5]